MSATPIAILLILGGLGWLAYAFSAPSDQQPITVRGKVVELRLQDVSRARGGTRGLVVVALHDGSLATVAMGRPSLCRVGDIITLDQYTNHLGNNFLRAGAHPCG